ncbi:Vam6/Vps39-like protein [Geranomyces variabilis]|uniref:Vam6/Vps39-like protein n=1 Tax=Geranomyces variabilis TaxID=109894 RepID=A0AAD5XR68_9FUNG|nr:Vam6/Vps39-like protein [Geranomyces variabilis]
MHTVFHAHALVERLPLALSALLAIDAGRLVAGADNGSLLLYTINADNDHDGGDCTVALQESRSVVSRKRVDAIFLVSAADAASASATAHSSSSSFLAVLSDGIIALRNVDTLAPIQQLDSVKGVTLMTAPASTVSVSTETKTSVPSVLCAAVKKKLVVFALTGESLVVTKEIALTDRPRCLLWGPTPTTLYIGYTRTISVVDLSSGTIRELHAFRTSIVSSFGNFAPMKQTSAMSLELLPNNRVLATREDTTIVLDEKGDIVPDLEVQWDRSPQQVVPSPPFVVGLFPGQLVVQNLRSGGSGGHAVQTLPLANAHLLAFGSSSSSLVASPSAIWRLIPIDFEDQIEQLVSASLFSQAQALVEDLDFPSESDKVANVMRIRGMYAHHLFRIEHKYAEALAILQELQASPLDIINLYPDLAPPEPGGGGHGDGDETGGAGGDGRAPAPDVPQTDSKAVRMLLTYLTEQRAVLAKLRLQQERHGAAAAASESLSLHAQGHDKQGNKVYPVLADTLYLSEVIDTTLLKVYLRINEALVGPLLRVSNYCNVEESEALLLERGKHDELVGLYRAKGLHRKALDFLKQKAVSPESTAGEVEKMVAYLHALNINDDMDLVLDYATWILQKDPEEGMKVFTEYYDDVGYEARKRIVRFLESISDDFAIAYLEHLITELGDTDPDLSDALVFCYIAKLKRELASRTGLQGPMVPKRDGGNAAQSSAAKIQPDSGRSFWDLRRKLAEFLETSTYYRAEKVLASFPTDALCEERATVLSRLKRHEEALRIYTEQVRNYRLANLYCERHYDPDDPASRDVFIILLRIYLAMVAADEFPMAEVHSFLTAYGASINAAQALHILPDTVPLQNLLGYFERGMHDMHRTRNMNEVVKNLLKAEVVQFKERLTHVQAKRIPITEERMCSICLKRIANSVFTHFPNGVVVHAYCASRK